MEDLVLTIVIFIIAHAVPAIAPLRRTLIGWFGRGAYLVGYSMISLGLLGFVGIAYSEAPFVALWSNSGAQAWTRWLPITVMPLASVFAVAVFTNPNPFSVALKSSGFDPARPGVVAITRHPLIWALVLWSSAHLVANGDLASLILFGLFTVMGALGPLSIEARKKRTLGADAWASQTAATSAVPFWAIVRGRARLDLAGLGWPTIVAGLALFAVLLWAHPWFVGVSPLP